MLLTGKQYFWNLPDIKPEVAIYHLYMGLYMTNMHMDSVHTGMHNIQIEKSHTYSTAFREIYNPGIVIIFIYSLF